MKPLSVFYCLVAISALVLAQPRARDLGIPFDGAPGKLNAITDVAGVEVGMTTLIEGSGTLETGKGPVRTGVTVVLPRGKQSAVPCFAGWWSLNGNGEMTGTTWVEESGLLSGPVAITNTHSVGAVHEAVIAWSLKAAERWGNSYDFSLPVVAETYDGFLNDINGFHVKREHVFAALEDAKTGPVAEGNVGGGTGMISFGFKAGTGTSSRALDTRSGGYTVGVLVQSNFGRRQNFAIAGMPVGKEITDLTPSRGAPDDGGGSIIVVVATDAPLLPHQLKRLAKRAGLGVGIVGGRGEDSSGDIFIAFSTANPEAASDSVATVRMLAGPRMNRLFEATVQATEEAIVNALVAARTMTGVNGNTVHALPQERVKDLLRKYGRGDSRGVGGDR
ncbi:MAG: P1 family peptidase [Bacteroidetes bacterium]|jgi:L-aminopeptidase/D-esterase-like protein|nr:P1 family peptidase [Bacteroidota bacterium]